MKKQPLIRKIIQWTFRTIGIIILIFLIWSLIPLKQTIVPIQARKDTKYWSMANGYKIAYSKIEGDSTDKKPFIIFLHGGPGGYIHSAIINQMEEVAKKGYDVYLLTKLAQDYLIDFLNRKTIHLKDT